jgi:hypothetical protein
VPQLAIAPLVCRLLSLPVPAEMSGNAIFDFSINKITEEPA